MAVFTPRPLQIPNMRTDYSAENSAFSNLGQTLGNMPSEFRKEQLNAQKQQILGQIGTGNMDYDKAGRALIALGDTQAGATLLTLGQKQSERDLEKAWMNGGGLGAPAAPVALGSPNEVENRFLGGVQKAGLTNPNGLAAVAAYGKSESGYSPGNVNKTWSDPSESGAAGTSGGIMSWRADRLQNLQNFARQRGEQGNGSPETQAAFLASEDPTLVPRLNAAKTPQEANQIMAQAWRFGGYDRPGQGEYARREGLTSQYAQRYAGAQPASAPAQPVQVAENEADVQRLEQAQAARPADAPAPGAANAQGFAIPGTGEVIPQAISTDPAVRSAMGRYVTAPTQRTRDAAKAQLDLAVADAKQRQSINQPTEETKNYEQFKREEVAAGRPAPSRSDYLNMKRTQINNNVGGAEKTYDQTVGKAQGEYFVETQKGGRDSRDQLTTLKRMRSLIDSPDFYSGAGGGRATAFKKLAVALGIKDAETAAPNELFDKLSKQSVLDKAGGSFGTGFSNGDREYIDATTANIENTPAGNRQIVDMGIKVAERRIEVARMAREYAKSNGGRLDSGFDDLMADYAAKNPLFSQEAPARAVPAAPPAAPPSPPQASAPAQRPAGRGPVTITNPTTKQRMMLTPDGRWEPIDG